MSSIQQDYSVVGYVKNVDEKSEGDDWFGSMKLRKMMEVEMTLHFDLLPWSDDH